MSKVETKRVYSWIFPLIGGLIAIGSLFTPAAYHLFDDINYDGIYIWMWGLIFYKGYKYGAIFIFQKNPESLRDNLASEFFSVRDIFGIVTSLISTLAILMCGIGLVSTAKKVKHLKMKVRVASRYWIVLSINMLVFAIFWMYTANLYYTSMHLPSSELDWENDLFEHKDFRFWAYFNPGFGIIGVFLAAGITFIGISLKSD